MLTDMPFQHFTLADWMDTLVALACRRRFSLFFLGDPPGAAERAPGICVSAVPA